MRIAIVNDMAMAAEVLKRIVKSKAPTHEVAWVAVNGAEAVEKCGTDVPDLILMDLLMPVMDGAEATRRIMAKSPCGILVVTASVASNFSKVFEALSYGALDAVNTPSIGLSGQLEGAAQLLQKIERLGVIRAHAADKPGNAKMSSVPAATSAPAPYLVAVGSSTGGPAALAQMLAELPADFGAAIVIIQHVDKEFATGLASWLETLTKLNVSLAVEGDTPKIGNVYLAATNDHLLLDGSMRFTYASEPLSNPFRPSVDVFFESVSRNWPRKGTAVVLTGIGRDGALGLLTLKNKGWRTIAQDKESSVVFGMPKAAAENGAAELVLPPDRIGQELTKILTGDGRS